MGVDVHCSVFTYVALVGALFIGYDGPTGPDQGHDARDVAPGTPAESMTPPVLDYDHAGGGSNVRKFTLPLEREIETGVFYSEVQALSKATYEMTPAKGKVMVVSCQVACVGVRNEDRQERQCRQDDASHH